MEDKRDEVAVSATPGSWAVEGPFSIPSPRASHAFAPAAVSSTPMTPSTSSSTQNSFHPAATPSSAAFLYHLHNDPSSHHITLPASSGRHAAASGLTLSNIPAPISQPLEPVVLNPNEPAISPSGGPPLLATSSESIPQSSSTVTMPKLADSATSGLDLSLTDNMPIQPSASGQSVAGPSTMPGPLRESSKRSIRPKTAPGRSLDGSDVSSRGVSSESSLTGRTEDVTVLEGSPRLGGWEDESVVDDVNDPDNCLTLASSDTPHIQSADNMMAIVGGERPSGTVLLGRAGSLAPSTSSDPIQNASNLVPNPVSWKTFSLAYAQGKFDPQKTPNPPGNNMSPVDLPSAHSSPGQSSRPLGPAPPQHPAQSMTVGFGLAQPRNSAGVNENSKKSMSAGSRLPSVNTLSNTSSLLVNEGGRSSQHAAPTDGKTSMAAVLAARAKSFDLESLPDRSTPSLSLPDKLTLPTYSFAAATVRMASSSLRESDFAPLAVPSPERELLDPLANVVSITNIHKEGANSDPGSIRYPLSRSMSSATPSTPGKNELLLPTIQASPVTTPEEPVKNRGGLPPHHRIPSATAPLAKAHDVESSNDYFGTASPHLAEQTSVAPTGEPTAVAPLPETRRLSNPQRPEIEPPPIAATHEIEELYEKFGWLAAPLPPNEAERKKALYRYNILHTAPDANFDRIAHMVKLVFNTKIVLLALIDGDKQWHKSHTGLGAIETDRITSFCSHCILATSEEPFVVLDTTSDWRFVNNPQVTGPPHIRFYAGAPLRTLDGYNLGSLCIIDDKPRSEFSPRSRLILKEFAAVAMRELELWRDKLQLRVRDRIQTSMEQFTRECLETDEKSITSPAEVAARMDQVYARAAKLVCQTLDLHSCVILDIGNFEGVQVERADGTKETIFRANPYSEQTQSTIFEPNDVFGPVPPFPVLATSPTSVPTRALTANEHERFSEFLSKNRDGKIFENIAPSWLRYMFPTSLKYGMVVPVFGVDQQPFAMICAYTLDKGKQFLEGYELQYLRAIGVIILSAVLRRRMVLADKAKSILISSVSHELRTPLHGILAAAELLQDTRLDSSQQSLLKTVQTCGKSLIETVNHVLDFTKLTGAGKGVNKDTIQHGIVDLDILVEQTVDSCWIGQRARTMYGDSDIGSFYAPDTKNLVPRSERAVVGASWAHVETVIDISHRPKGWKVHCEKGGLRRVLMNLVGNSLKFTKDGYVQISLRELPHSPGSKTIPVEMAVIDTGKGISKEFLKEHLFHPFSQENPLQTGTGLGLAIVNSIVRSESVNGKVDVWSSEGKGTEIRVSFDVELVEEDGDGDGATNEDMSKSITSSSSEFTGESSFGKGFSIFFFGFVDEHRGLVLSREVLGSYVTWWSFDVVSDPANANIVLVNELGDLPTNLKDASKAIIFLTSTKSTNVAAQRIDPIIKSGGWAITAPKPIGPSSLRRALREATKWLENGCEAETPLVEKQSESTSSPDGGIERPPISRGSSGESGESQATVSDLPSFAQSPNHLIRSTVEKDMDMDSRHPLQRRRSEEDSHSQKQRLLQRSATRPSMGPRGMTYHSTPQQKIVDEVASQSGGSGTSSPSSPSAVSTISLADGGVMLKAATIPSEAPRAARKPRVMVVEDNIINRKVLGAYLRKKGVEFEEAHDGQAGVELFAEKPANHWDIILMDISMPVMNGYEATKAIRGIEASRRYIPTSELPKVPSPGKPVIIPPTPVVQQRTKIFALTGLATPDDKRQAFGSGVDGYLVKPVSLASLDLIFKKIGF